MPSSGLPIQNLWEHVDVSDSDRIRHCAIIKADAKNAMTNGLFIEWLESFVGAWNKSKEPLQASLAGIIEWDL